MMEQIYEKCQNKSYDCSWAAQEGQQFCIKHILQDTKQTKYKQCAYFYTGTNKQCTQARQQCAEEKNDTNYSPFCIEHSRLTQLMKTKSSIGSFKNIDSTETIVNSLRHHVKLDKVKPQSTTKISPHDEEDVEVDVEVDPFLDVNATDINNKGKNILDFASDSSSDEDTPTTMVNTWRSHELDHSDDESVDSSDDDLLKHAGIFTVDEVVTISKAKMQRLQALYIDQFQRLQYVLREKRRQYLQDLKKERDTLSSIHDQAKDSPKERDLYKKLKAMNHYHRRYGVEALLHRQYLEKRRKQMEAATPGAVSQQKNFPKCIFSEGGVKCNERSLPMCRHCRKHIMEDKKQIFFKSCGVEKSGILCQEPVANIFEHNSCVLHTTLPTPKTYIKRKYESETESDGDESRLNKEDVEMDATTSTTQCETIIDSEDINVEETKIEPTSTDELVIVA